MTPTTVTIADLRHLDAEAAKTSIEIRRIRIAAERGDLSPDQVVRRLRHIGVIITPRKSTNPDTNPQ